MEIKAKISKWALIKLKSFCITKETISEVKRWPLEWEKIIANEAADKENLLFIWISPSLYQEDKDDSKSLEIFVNGSDRDLNLHKNLIILVYCSFLSGLP